MSDNEWEEAIGGASPAMHSYVEGMNRDLERRGGLRRDCSNLAGIKVAALKEALRAEITDGFDRIPGETLAHKLVFLARPTGGEMGFLLTSTTGTEVNIFMTNDPVIRAKLEASLN
jgi:hypothetical protein